ncbi:phage major capsid protein [Blastococcus brunescens]|uniref:Phage major capsid protein n=1 Tax=Blastococcus brunescens TaxID=1564165 RepID=A0ABZ1B6R5_9ACTN|nr:phage major capsid protein [Blastococcus sp. BMG 8361]WRL65811.1 phage major capsid protein [Blastococcus sp. BMG 8361]
MTLTTGTAGPLLTPEQVENLLVLPVLAASVALNPLVSTVVRLTGSTYRIPKVTADPSAAWVAEGAEIPVSDLTTNELVVVPSKVAGLSVITSELAADSSPAASTEVGAGLARDIARKIDAAFFGGVAANTPSGLASLTVGESNVQDIAAGIAPTSLDAFAQAQMLAGTSVPS